MLDSYQGLSNEESFSSLLEKSVSQISMTTGCKIHATVMTITEKNVVVNIGLKSDAIIPINEFRDNEVKIGDIIDVILKSADNGFGQTKVSFEDAERIKIWESLEVSYRKGETVYGSILERVKGGFIVLIENMRAFLPGSLIDIRPVRDPSYLEGRELEFKIIKMDHKRNNVVVSRRAILQETSIRSTQPKDFQDGKDVIGIIKNITDYGAFVDLGGIDGLLHITDMSWKRVKNPREKFRLGQEIKLRVLKFDRAKQRISLGLKQLTGDPWKNINSVLYKGNRTKGKITNITDYGCFAEISEGIEGLIHMSEMLWGNKNIHPNKVVKVGQYVDVVVLDFDRERRRVSLGMKQLRNNPWKKFLAKYRKNDIVYGVVKSVTDYGIFVGLPGNIDALVHLSDISWCESSSESARNYQRGDKIKTMILSINGNRERVCLGIKQTALSRTLGFINNQESNTIFTCKIVKVRKFYSVVQLKYQVFALLLSEKGEESRRIIKLGEEIKVKIDFFDHRSGKIIVSSQMPGDLPDKKPALIHRRRYEKNFYKKNKHELNTINSDSVKDKHKKYENKRR